MEGTTEKESRQCYCSTSIASSKPTTDSLAESSNGGSSDCESCGGQRRNPASCRLSRSGPHISAFNTARGSFGTSSTVSASSSDDTSNSVTTIRSFSGSYHDEVRILTSGAACRSAVSAGVGSMDVVDAEVNGIEVGGDGDGDGIGREQGIVKDISGHREEKSGGCARTAETGAGRHDANSGACWAASAGGVSESPSNPRSSVVHRCLFGRC